MNDDVKLQEYQVKRMLSTLLNDELLAGSTIHMVLQLRGG